jgi:hypothetical protein
MTFETSQGSKQSAGQSISTELKGETQSPIGKYVIARAVGPEKAINGARNDHPFGWETDVDTVLTSKSILPASRRIGNFVRPLAFTVDAFTGGSSIGLQTARNIGVERKLL